MTRHSLQQCVADLDEAGQLVRVNDPVSPLLEMAEIQRRVYRSGGPAVLFENAEGCQFPMLGNLFGTIDRRAFHLPQDVGSSTPSYRVEDRPATILQAPTSVSACLAHGAQHATAAAIGRPRLRQGNQDQRITATEIVA